MPDNNQFKEKFYHSRLSLGRFAVANGSRKASRTFNVPISTAEYWRNKALNPAFHDQDWGGQKSFKLSEEQREFWQGELWALLKDEGENTLTVTEMRQRLFQRTNLDISLSMIYRQLHSWKFTVKKAFAVQRAKYTLYNIAYYLEFVNWFANLGNYSNVKVMGEAHFDGGKLQARNRVWSEKGNKNVTNSTLAMSPLIDNFNCSAIIGLAHDQHPVFYDFRSNSNTQYDWYEFVVNAVEKNYLRDGDILILDNAAVHTGEDTIGDVLEFLEDEHNIDVRFLPTYSPELSPIELIFNIVKQHIKSRRVAVSLGDAIFEGFDEITREKVQNCFAHVLAQFVQVPFALPPGIHLGDI